MQLPEIPARSIHDATLCTKRRDSFLLLKPGLVWGLACARKIRLRANNISKPMAGAPALYLLSPAPNV